MPSSVINSDDGVISGTAGLKSVGGDDGVLVFQSKGTETARINTDKQIVAAAGTASLPALTTTGDLNTGIFFPAADTIAFAEGGAEAMRIDSIGNVGVGTTSPTNYSDYKTLTVSNALTTLGGVLRVQNSNSSTVGIAYVDGGLAFTVKSETNHPLILGTNNTERARITNGGIFCSGRTTAIDDANSAGAGNFQATSTALEVYRTSTSTNTMTQFFSDEGSTKSNRFQFRCNGGLANYQANDANLSDRREKTDFALSKNYLDTICSIPVQTFKYIGQSDDELTLGVVAQDVQEVAPELISESNWGTQEEPKMRLSIYQTDLQYALMKCIQELKAELDEAKARIATLEAVPGNE